MSMARLRLVCNDWEIRFFQFHLWLTSEVGASNTGGSVSCLSLVDSCGENDVLLSQLVFPFHLFLSEDSKQGL